MRTARSHRHKSPATYAHYELTKHSGFLFFLAYRVSPMDKRVQGLRRAAVPRFQFYAFKFECEKRLQAEKSAVEEMHMHLFRYGAHTQQRLVDKAATDHSVSDEWEYETD